MSAAEELTQILTARFQKSGMQPRAAATWARIAVEAIADALEERGMEVWDREDDKWSRAVDVVDGRGYL